MYEDLLGDGSVAAAVLDTELRMLATNEAGRALLGYVPERLLGEGHDDAFAFSQDWLRGELAVLLEVGSWQGDIALRHRDGHIVPIWVYAAVVARSGGAVIVVMLRPR